MNRLRLVWVDAEGEPWHSVEVPPAVARDLIRREVSASVYIDRSEVRVGQLTYAAVQRARRCAVVQLTSGYILIGCADECG